MALINPFGNRFGSFNFWQGAHPVVYSKPFKGFETIAAVRLLVNTFLIQVTKLYRHKKSAARTLQGLAVKVISNVWGFGADQLSVYFTLFDYQLVDQVIKTTRKRFFIRRFLRFLRQNTLIQKSSLIFNLDRTFYMRLVFAKGQSLARRLRQFISRYFRYVRRSFTYRITAWHRLVVVLTRPYLFMLMKRYKFKRIFFQTSLRRSSFTAGMIARFIILKLRQNISVNQAIKILRQGMEQLGMEHLVGYKVCLSGRFTRKQLATYRWARYGSLLLNQIRSAVDYAYDRGYSRFGAYGLKLWMFYS